jgi:hypothetical protein
MAFFEPGELQRETDPNAWMDAQVRAEKWRNLYFLTNGRTFRGRGVYDSERSAQQACKRSLDEGMAHPKRAVTRVDTGELVPIDNISHTIQMPVKS